MNDESSEYGNDVTEADERPASKTNASKKPGKKAGKKAVKAATKAAAKAAKTRSAALKRRNDVGARDTESESRTPVTEIPVPSPPRPKTSQYLVTVDNSTGVPTKVEKVDSETGDKKELSESESIVLASAMISPLASAFASPFAAAPSVAIPYRDANVTGVNSLFEGAPSEDTALTEAYYRGVADYLHALGLA